MRGFKTNEWKITEIFLVHIKTIDYFCFKIINIKYGRREKKMYLCSFTPLHLFN